MPAKPQESPARARLRLVQTTDVHGHLLAFDYALDRPGREGSLVQAADVIDGLRSEALATLVLDCGDFLQGTPLAAPPTHGCPGSPVITAMNHIEYDAVTLGNHDLDHGAGPLQRALCEARFPVVASNLCDTGDLGRLLHPALMIERQIRLSACRTHPIRIGVLGVLPPQVDGWTAGGFDPPLSTSGILEAVARGADSLRRKGADLVIVLSHSGEGPGAPSERLENAATALQQQGVVDAVLAGHSHKISPAPGKIARHGPGETPIVAAGAFGRMVGVIDLDLDLTGDGTWIPAGSASRVIPTADQSGEGPLARAIRNDLQRPHARAREDQNAILRRAPVGMASHFSMVMPDLAQACLARAIRGAADSLLDGHDLAALPRLVAAPPMSVGGYGGPSHYFDAPDGIIRRRHIGQLFPFPNPVVLIELNGAQVHDWLERAASVFNRLTPGLPGQTLLSRHAASYNFDVMHGLEYEIDLSGPARFTPTGELCDPAASRIRRATIDGRPVTQAERFVVATSSYRAGGGGRVRALDSVTAFARSHQTIPTILANWFRARGWTLPDVPPAWRFSRLSDTRVRFATAPEAPGRPGTGPGPVRPTGEHRDGFAIFELDLDPPSLANPGRSDYLNS